MKMFVFIMCWFGKEINFVPVSCIQYFFFFFEQVDFMSTRPLMVNGAKNWKKKMKALEKR